MDFGAWAPDCQCGAALTPRGAAAGVVLVCGRATDDGGDGGARRVHAVWVACHDHLARVACLVDLEAGTGLRLDALDGLAPPADNSSHHLLGALHGLARLPWAHKAAATKAPAVALLGGDQRGVGAEGLGFSVPAFQGLGVRNCTY
jgi:hypothetical protein